jgi:pimeloyl-ACP methyl ester carboxylesterase
MTILALIVAAVFVAVVVYYVFPEKTAAFIIDKARSGAGFTKKQITIDDHDIVYLEGGKGPTVLLLHGYTAEKDNWLGFVAYLNKNYHVVIPDIPGYGESTKLMDASYDLNTQIDRLNKFVHALNLEEFHIAGSSMGGLFSGTYAVRYPNEVLSVGLFNAAGVASPQKSEVMKKIEAGVNPLVLQDEKDFLRIYRMLFVNPPPLPYPLKKAFIKTALDNRKFYEKALREIGPDFLSLEKQLPRIKAPVLILWGDQDKIIDVSSVAVFEKGIKNHQTVIIKDCGHVPMIEKPRQTAAHYLDFIKGVNN